MVVFHHRAWVVFRSDFVARRLGIGNRFLVSYVLAMQDLNVGVGNTCDGYPLVGRAG